MINERIEENYIRAIKRFDETHAKNPISHELVSCMFKKRPSDAYKGSCGRLFVCGGSTGLTGAATLSCLSALRCGCGLLTLGCPKSLNQIFEVKLTEVMTQPLDDTDGILNLDSFEKIMKKSNLSDAVLIGPGMARSDDVISLVHKLIENISVPLVVDADGLYAISKNVDILKNSKSPLILTPHVGEFSLLSKTDIKSVLENPKDQAKKFASKYNVVLVLKSHQTIVALPNGEIFENILGSPAMATGGTGDVLSGAIASFLAQSSNAVLSALAGVYIHSLAADMATFETGEYSLIPSDIIEYIKYAIRETSYRS